jgi:hypothetical protein
MDTWVQVEKLQDGESVNSEVLNTPIEQLASRTEYLKRRLGTIIENGIQSALILSDVDLDTEDLDSLEVGMVVYKAEHGFRRAQAKMHLYDDYTADDSAFTIGILVAKTEKKGDVLIYGKLDIGEDPLLTVAGMLQDGEKFRSGRYYLSANEPGRITANPSGPLIYIGSFHSAATTSGEYAPGAFACINPQFMDIGTSHVHRAYPLVARPAGDLDGTSVIGYLPSDHSADKHYPSLIFGGTWTSTPDVTYDFFLSESSAWGEVTLSWKKDGDDSYKERVVPAPGVFIDLDNGLKVKVMFPDANSSHAFAAGSLELGERSWRLTFPWAGKGWVNHSVEAIAQRVADASGSGESSPDDELITPDIRAVFYGAWPDSDNTVFCAFPQSVREVSFPSEDDLTAYTVDGVTYEFVDAGYDESSLSGDVPVVKGGTIAESLVNLAAAVNKGIPPSRARLLAHDDSVVEVSYDDAESSDGSSTGGSFDVVGGTIPLMVVYTADYELLRQVFTDVPTYAPIWLGGDFHVLVYAPEATTSHNYTCHPGTVLMATAYDYAPDAVYDYVMGLHQSVDFYYPPVPAQAAGLFVNGVEMENAALFPDNPTYCLGRKTIHWMEDDIEHLPWPYGITSHDDPVDPADDKTIAFYFIVGFQCASGPVTSIVPAPNSPIKVYTYGTNEAAYTGDLMIDADLDLKTVDAGVKGFNVPKRSKGGNLLTGPVVEKIKGGTGIVVTQEAGCPVGQGTVTISLDNGTLREHFNEVALENAKQEKLGLFPYISLLGWGTGTNIPSAFTLMMRVPTSLDPDKNYQLQVRMTMFGALGYKSTAKRVAGIQMEYNILPDYTGDTHSSLKTGLIAPENPRVFTVPFGHIDGREYSYVAYDPFVASTEYKDDSPEVVPDVKVPFTSLPIPSNEELPGVHLKPGYLVAIRISRTSPSGVGGLYETGEYTGPIGFLSMEWTLEEA